jgi:hypothetical protein
MGVERWDKLTFEVTKGRDLTRWAGSWGNNKPKLGCTLRQPRQRSDIAARASKVSLLSHTFRRMAWQRADATLNPCNWTLEGPTAPRLRQWASRQFSAAAGPHDEPLKFWVPPPVIPRCFNPFEQSCPPAFPACEGWRSGPGQTRSITARQTVPIAVDVSGNRL